MNNKIKFIAKLLAILFMLTLTNCTNDFHDETKIDDTKIISKYITIKELSAVTLAINELESVNERITANKSSRLVHNSQYDFYIDTDKILSIQNGNNQSYTIPIYRSNSDGNIENLVLNKNSIGSYNSYISKYTLSATEKEQVRSNQSVELSQTPEITLLRGDGDPDVFYIAADGTCYGYVVDKVLNENSNGPRYVFIAQIVAVPCPESTGGDPVNYNGVSYGDNAGGLGSLSINTSGWGFGTYGLNGNIGSSNIPNGGGGGPANYDGVNITTAPVFEFSEEFDNMQSTQFYNSLLSPQKGWAISNPSEYYSLITFLKNSNWSNERDTFAKEIMNLAIAEPNQQDVNSLINLTIKLEENSNNLFDDAFIQSLDPYIDLDLANDPDPVPKYLMIGVKVFLDYNRLRRINPEWPRAKCWMYASKGIIHMSLDVFGLVPVGGEIADLVNGVLYTIEGDHVNAAFSYASTVPIAGWAAFGVKYAVKIETVYATGAKIKHVYKVLADGTIYFGTNSTCRAQLRRALGMVVGNANQAHHIIPLNLQRNPIVQSAFNSPNAFHLNEALNGISLSTLVHSGSHSAYDGKILERLIEFNRIYPNATPSQCYNEVSNIISDIRTAIANNPNTKINLLNF